MNINIQDKSVNIKIENIVNTLCSDEFEGRLLGIKGNDRTVQYISDIFEKLKLDFLFHKSYFHKYILEVPNRERSSDITITAKNVVGKVSGNNNKNAIIISAHFDHIGVENGEIYRRALDNASGVSALLKIAYALKEASEKEPFDFDIIISAFNGEEFALSGSKAFVKDIRTKYNKIFNINIDSIGSINGGNLALKNISKIKDSEKLYEGIKNIIKKHKIEFSNTAVSEKAFEAGIPNIYIGQEGIKPLVHELTDTPEMLDYIKMEKIAEAIYDFIKTNGLIMFQEM